MKKTILTSLLMMVAMCLSATTYYCSPSGKGDGSSVASAGSFTSLVKNLKAGDILYLLDGQYNFSDRVNVSCSGTKDKFVNIWAYESAKPIFDFRKQAYGNTGFSTSGDYVYMKGITIRYAGKNGLYNSGSYCKFEMMDVYGNGDSGVQMKGGHNNLILNCDSHDNFDYKQGGLDSGSTDLGGNADGFADKQYTGGGNTYIGCRSWRNSDDGWDFYQHKTGGYGPTVLENCICYENGPLVYENMQNHARYETDKSWFDQFKGEGLTLLGRLGKDLGKQGERTVTLEKYCNWGNANGFKLGGGQTNHDVKVINCISVNNGNDFILSLNKGAKGIDQNNNAGTMWVYNNTALGNTINIGFDQPSCGTLYLYNNISYKGVKPDVINCATHTELNNSWDLDWIEVSDADFQSLDDALVLSPRNADGSLAETPLLRLTATSQMIDAGTKNTELDYYGSAPDLGAYETKEGTSHVAIAMSVEGAKKQTVRQGRAIAPVLVTVSGGAEQLKEKTPSNIPGVTVTVAGNKATISGTPTQVGEYSVVLVPVVDYDTNQNVTITITVTDASAPVVAYVSNGTTGTNAADEKIIEAISKGFQLKYFDASATNNDYSDCDAIVVSPVPSSSATGVKNLKGNGLPTLLLKPFMMKAKVWDWGTAANTSDIAVKVKQPEHDIFKGIKMQNSTLNLFTAKDGDGAVTAISSPANWSNYSLLATPTSNDGYISIADLTGATLSGTKINQRYIMIGISEYSTANLTEEGKQLVLNAMYYIMNIDTPTAIKGCIDLRGEGPEVYYDMTGRQIMEPTPGTMYLIKKGNGVRKGFRGF